MSCPKYRGTGKWWENYLKKNKKKFEAQGLKHEFFGKNGNQWTYKGADLCVGIGRHNKKCDNKNLFCAGKNKNGGGIHQINAIIKAAKNLTDNGRPHPSCPIQEYGTEIIKSDRPVLALGTSNVVTFQFRRDGRLQMFKKNGSKENLFCVEQVIEKKCRTSAYHNAILCNNGEYCDSSGKNGFKCCDTKGGINKCPKGYNMCNNGKCNKSVEGFTVREDFESFNNSSYLGFNNEYVVENFWKSKRQKRLEKKRRLAKLNKAKKKAADAARKVAQAVAKRAAKSLSKKVSAEKKKQNDKLSKVTNELDKIKKDKVKFLKLYKNLEKSKKKY